MKPLPKTAKPTSHVLEKAHTDTCGPFVKSIHSNKYALNVVDDKSRLSMIYFLPKKDATTVLDRLKHWKAIVETITGRKLKVLQSDCGTEYKNKDQRFSRDRRCPSTAQHPRRSWPARCV